MNTCMRNDVTCVDTDPGKVALNHAQIGWILDSIDRHLGGLAGRRIAVLGLAVKPNTDDVRESPDQLQDRTQSHARRPGLRRPEHLQHGAREREGLSYAGVGRPSVARKEPIVVVGPGMLSLVTTVHELCA